MTTSPVLAIVLPCYNEEAVLATTARKVDELINTMIQTGKIAPTSFACFVDDGSQDNTWDIIQELTSRDPLRFRTVKLSRNYGHQQAILAGMETVVEHCDCCITIDADLQDDLNAIQEMVDKFRSGEAEIVLGVRRKRTVDTPFKRLTAKAFYRVLDWIGCKSVDDHADFRLMSRKALRHLSEYREYNLFLRGIIVQLGLKTAIVHYDRMERTAGTTKYTLSKMCNLALVGITSFSVMPLRFLFSVGLAFFILSTMLTCWFLISYGLGNTVPGWATLATSIWTLGGIQLMALGILGEYIGRIFMEVKQRPRYLIDEQTVSVPASLQGKFGVDTETQVMPDVVVTDTVVTDRKRVA